MRRYKALRIRSPISNYKETEVRLKSRTHFLSPQCSDRPPLGKPMMEPMKTRPGWMLLKTVCSIPATITLSNSPRMLNLIQTFQQGRLKDSVRFKG